MLTACWEPKSRVALTLCLSPIMTCSMFPILLPTNRFTLWQWYSCGAGPLINAWAVRSERIAVGDAVMGLGARFRSLSGTWYFWTFYLTILMSILWTFSFILSYPSSSSPLLILHFLIAPIKKTKYTCYWSHDVAKHNIQLQRTTHFISISSCPTSFPLLSIRHWTLLFYAL